MNLRVLMNDDLMLWLHTLNCGTVLDDMRIEKYNFTCSFTVLLLFVVLTLITVNEVR